MDGFKTASLPPSFSVLVLVSFDFIRLGRGNGRNHHVYEVDPKPLVLAPRSSYAKAQTWKK
jgi:hypothetical protein